MQEWKDIVRFNDKYFPDWRNRELIFYSNALAGEVGEICNLVKKAYGGGTNRKQESYIEMVDIEAIDAFIYLVLLFETVGIDREKFNELFNFKMRILERRMTDLKTP